MTIVDIECLRCGTPRAAERRPGNIEAATCPSCGYAGWAHLGSLTDQERHELHQRLGGLAAREAAWSAA